MLEPQRCLFQRAHSWGRSEILTFYLAGAPVRVRTLLGIVWPPGYSQKFLNRFMRFFEQKVSEHLIILMTR